MPLLPRNILKQYFMRGDRPTEGQFDSLLDSTLNIVDDRYLLGLRVYEPAKIYLTGDTMLYNNSLYRCIADTTGVFNPASWAIVSALGAVVYAGAWDAAANSPQLSDATGTKGFYYVVSVPGTIDLGSGILEFQVSDWAIYNGTIWQKVDNTQTGSTDASDVSFTPNGDITAVNVQDAIVEARNTTDVKLNGKQDIFSLTPNYYPFANTPGTLANGLISHAPDGVVLDEEKVFRSYLPNAAQIEFPAGDTVKITNNSGSGTEVRLLIDAALASLLHEEFGELKIAKGPNFGGEVTLLNNDANGILANSEELKITSNSGSGASFTMSSGKIDVQSDSFRIFSPVTNFNSLGASTVPYIDGSRNLVSSSVTPAELANLSGSTSPLQPQFNAKLNIAGGTMTGDLVLNTNPSIGLGAATKQYVDGADTTLQNNINGKLALAGGTLTGNLILNANPTLPLGATTKQYVDAADTVLQTSINGKLNLAGGTLTGNLILNANPVALLGAATKQYVDTATATKLNLAGGTLTGNLILNANPTLQLGATTKQYVDAADTTLQTSINGKLALAGGTMTGNLVLNASPVAPLGAATKQYVDTADGTKLNLTGGTLTGPLILNANPVSGLEAATKQYVDASSGGTQVNAIALPFTFFLRDAPFIVSTANTWTRLTSSSPVLQMRVVIPPCGTIFPGTTRATGQIVVDYSAPGSDGRVGLYDYTRFQAVVPISGSDFPLPSAGAFGVIAGPAFSLLGSGGPIPVSSTVEIILQKTSGVGAINLNCATLIVTYS